MKICKINNNIRIKINNIKFDILTVESGENSIKQYKKFLDINTVYNEVDIDDAIKAIAKVIHKYYKEELIENVKDAAGQIEIASRKFYKSKTEEDIAINRKNLRIAIQNYHIAEKELRIEEGKLKELKENNNLDNEITELLENEINKIT